MGQQTKWGLFQVRWRVLTASLLSAGLGVTLWALTRQPWLNEAVRIMFLILGAVAFVGGVWVWLWRGSKADFFGDGVSMGDEIPSKEEIQAAMVEVGNRYQEETVALFLRALVVDRNRLTRVDERAAFTGNDLSIRTELTLAIDGGDNHATTLLVPAIMSEKRKLLDWLEITDAGGTALPTLSLYDQRGLLAIVLRSLFLLGKKSSGARRWKVLDDNEDCVLWKVLTDFVCQARIRLPQPGVVDLPLLSLQNLLRQHPLDAYPAWWHEKMENLCRILTNNYFIVVEVAKASSGHLILVYRQRLAIDRSTAGRHEVTRARFGLLPNHIDAPLTRALEAKSYHFQLDVGPERYVFDHRLERRGTRESVSEERLAGSGHFASFYQDEARSAAHLYLRRQDNSTTQSNPDLKTIVTLRETPPGTLGGIRIIAIVNAAIILLFTIGRIGLRNANGIGADVPALLLALPAFVTVVLGHSLDSGKIPSAPLPAYVGFVWTTILSFLSALYYMVDSEYDLPTAITIDFAWGLRWPTDIGWLVLSGLAVGLVAYLAQEARARSKYYFQLLNERVRRAVSS